jgi:hypothetical protein
VLEMLPIPEMQGSTSRWKDVQIKYLIITLIFVILGFFFSITYVGKSYKCSIVADKNIASLWNGVKNQDKYHECRVQNNLIIPMNYDDTPFN